MLQGTAEQVGYRGHAASGQVFLQQQNARCLAEEGVLRIDNGGMNQIARYLSGESFSDDLAFQPQIIGHSQPRGDVLVQQVAGRRVLHVGFADHVPLIASRVADGSWLHARLSKSAAVCMGIDINPLAVATAKGLGFDNVHELDIFADQARAQLSDWQIDLVLVPDVIEHLPDPAAFLRRLVSCLPEAEYVVTVPNGLSLRNMMNGMAGVERINTDHRAWFSPFTLLKVLADAGLQANGLHACQVTSPSTVKGHVLHRLTQWRPIWSDVLLVQARA
ncbi:MAG: hypothetical protein RL300_1790 [Pseudomonadota bacterium]